MKACEGIVQPRFGREANGEWGMANGVRREARDRFGWRRPRRRRRRWTCRGSCGVGRWRPCEARDGVGNHPPLAIYLLLGVLCVVGSMLLGYSLSPSRNAHWLHRLSFAGITALAIDVILNLDFPRRGLIRVDGEDAVLVELGRTLDARP